MSTRSSRSFFANIDWWLILIYFALASGGILSIFSSLYEGVGAELPSRFVNQIMWVGISVTIGVIILLIDSKYLFIHSYSAFILMLIVMIAVAFFGKEIKGARSWIAFGGFSLQPVEFMKIATSLALARFMSSYSFDMNRVPDFITVCAIIATPIMVIFLQNDTGSALVFGSFLLMLYREGLNKWFYIAGMTMIAIFVGFFLLDEFALIFFIIFFTVTVSGINHGVWMMKIRYLAVLSLIFILLYIANSQLFNSFIEPYILLVISFTITIPFIIVYFLHVGGRGVIKYCAYIICSILCFFSIDYVFDNVMQFHQRKRVLDYLGVESDIYAWGYNAYQSKIAIGSGGLIGKGFLEGTQTKFNFVPEQSTDFIYCTIGEEFGFIGSCIVIFLFGSLILRLIHIGDRLFDSYSRIYCYCVASIFLFHVLINIGMTIGLAPVIGIPLPFFSYGGSSLLAFTILLSIALKLNMDNFEKK